MNRENARGQRGEISVREAGRRGGQTTSQTHGREFYEEIGQKGGQKVRELIRRGQEAERSGR